MKTKISIFLLLLLLCSCGAKKKMVPPVETEPLWHTALVTNTMLSLDLSNMSYSAVCQMQTVRDSMLVISIMPLMNIEMIRLEVTPKEAIFIDKFNHVYSRIGLEDAQDLVVPAMKWEDLQAFAAGENMKEGESATLGYSFRTTAIRLKVTYGTVAYDAPVNVRNMRLDKYEFVDPDVFLK